MYPRLAELGIPIHDTPIPHVKWADLKVALGGRIKKFDRLFGVQTCSMDGPYPHDVEAVLERMASGRMTGTQLEPD